jgi:hypothetical protein
VVDRSHTYAYNIQTMKNIATTLIVLVLCGCATQEQSQSLITQFPNWDSRRSIHDLVGGPAVANQAPGDRRPIIIVNQP